MDPICHTLVGASLGCTGLEKKTRFGRTTLIIAANLPDVDVVAHFWGGASSYAFRRGVTHGLPALVVLPILLALLIMALNRMLPVSKSGRETSVRWLLILSGVGVASHPALDWLNTYGMRWLMPVVNEWYYGDTLFIIDWIVWVVLFAGLVATRVFVRAETPWIQRPAVWSLAVVLAYIGMNFGITAAAERTAREVLADDPPARLLASPVPFNPFRRQMVFEYDAEYRWGSFVLDRDPQFALEDYVIDKGNPADFRRALTHRDGRWFLHWARFPYAVAETLGGRRTVHIADARYIRDIDNPRIDGFAIITFRWMDDAENVGAKD